MAKILVVDDDPAGRELIATVLSYRGHVLLEAADGAEGLQKARQETPDLIIADLLMPTMDGFEFVRRLREEPAFSATPVVFYTASYLESEARHLAATCGVRHILTKPVEPEQIIEVVHQALGSPPVPVPPPPVEEFRQEHLGLLTAKLSQKAALAIPRLNEMIELSLRFASERDPQHLLEVFCASARKIIGARHAVVAVLDRNEARWRYCFASGMDAETAGRIAAQQYPSQVRDEVLTERNPRRLHDLPGDPRAAGLPSVHPPVHSMLCVPIVSPERVYGWHCLTNKIGGAAFTEEDEGLAQILAAQVGRIYENGSLYAEIKRRAEELEHEVAQRRELEAELRDSKEHFQSIFQNSPLAISITSLEQGRLIDVNDAFLRLLGYHRDEVIGRTVEELRLDADPLARRRRVAALEQNSPVLNLETQLVTKAGGVRDVLLSAELIRVGTQSRVITIASDITESKQLEKQLRQSQKMESVGQLAGGVAHDFNNILTVVLGHVATIQTASHLPREVEAAADEISLAAERASRLTRQLLAFSRRQVIQLTDLDLARVIGDMTDMLRRLIGEDIALDFIFDPDLPLIRADAGTMEQVLLNLVVNSRDAMPKGGRLTIATGTETVGQEAARQNPEAARGRFVCLSVSDTGCGIAREHLPRIFEPFFTTKEVGKGSGLGLATVYGIVKQHHGWITVRSELNEGTTFKIFLPALKRQRESPPEPSRPRQAIVPGGTETILLVEDSGMVRDLTRGILRDHGYHVLEADSSVEALSLWEETGSRIDLLFTDIVMPDGMNGIELAAKLRQQRANLKVLLTSGYSADMMEMDTSRHEALGFLQKPYTPTELVRAVRDCLDQS